MSIVSKINPKGVDNVIDAIQQYIYPNLLGEGWTNYECYPRANKNPKDGNIIPEVASDTKDYKEVLFDDKFNATSFFLVDDRVEINNEERLIVQRVSLIFQVKLDQLFTTVPHRADEEMHVQITQLLTQNEELFVDINGYVTTPSQVYADLGLGDHARGNTPLDDMSEFHVVRYDFTVTYDLDACDVDFSPVCAPASILINGLSFVVVSSGATEDIPVRDTTDTPVGFDDGGIWRVPAAGVGADHFLAITGQETAYLQQDDGQNFLDGLYTNAILTDFYTLVNDNEWGHKKRFTGDTGGYMDEATGNFFDESNVATTKVLAFPNNIMRDYAFRRRWYLLRSGSRNWTDSMNNIEAESRGGEINWRLPTKAEYETLSSNNTKSPTYIDSRLFNWSTFNMWSSTTNKNNTAQANRTNVGDDSWSMQAKTVAAGNAYIKNF